MLSMAYTFSLFLFIYRAQDRYVGDAFRRKFRVDAERQPPRRAISCAQVVRQSRQSGLAISRAARSFMHRRFGAARRRASGRARRQRDREAKREATMGLLVTAIAICVDDAQASEATPLSLLLMYAAAFLFRYTQVAPRAVGR